MKALDHDTVFAKICSQFDTFTKSGRLSQTKSRNIFNFFCALEIHGADVLKSGNSGNSTGPHLHFSVKEFGQNINPTHFLNDLIKVNQLIATYYAK